MSLPGDSERTLVYGLGESGESASRALTERGFPVLAADSADTKASRAGAARLRETGVEVWLGAGDEVLSEVDRVVTSPGVPPRDPVLSEAERRGVPILSEVALALKLLGDGVRVAAVTGTNGKTTVADMTRSILEASGIPHVVSGNSWGAVTGRLEEIQRAGSLVLEVSSFQLHYLFGPGFEAAALLNVRPDHMNWHDSFEEYKQDKLRIFEGQEAGNLALLSAHDTVCVEAASSLEADALLVGDGDTLVEEGGLYLRGVRMLETAELGFAGTHNYENALFAAAMAQSLGAGEADIRRGLSGYRMKPHRMQVVGERDGVLYVDDSKATNPAAVASALLGLDRPVVLLLGGSEKHTDFSEVAGCLKRLKRCRTVVCYGEAGERIAASLSGAAASCGVEVVYAPGLEDAVSRAELLSRAGDVVLLAPGCASFDEFSGYAERGEAFSRLCGARGPAEYPNTREAG